MRSQQLRRLTLLCVLPHSEFRLKVLSLFSPEPPLSCRQLFCAGTTTGPLTAATSHSRTFPREQSFQARKTLPSSLCWIKLLFGIVYALCSLTSAWSLDPFHFLCFTHFALITYNLFIYTLFITLRDEVLRGILWKTLVSVQKECTYPEATQACLTGLFPQIVHKWFFVRGIPSRWTLVVWQALTTNRS